MKDLNDLVELAKRANTAGQGTPEMADFRVTASPDNILAIAEAFRALEQENILLKQGCENNPLVHELIDWKERSQAAASDIELGMQLIKRIELQVLEYQAKLAEFENQETIYQIEDADGWQDYSKDDFENFKAAGNIPDCYFRKLFTRPAPAVSLAKLVPEESDIITASMYSEREQDGWNACRAAILRNIEEQSQ